MRIPPKKPKEGEITPKLNVAVSRYPSAFESLGSALYPCVKDDVMLLERTMMRAYSICILVGLVGKVMIRIDAGMVPLGTVKSACIVAVSPIVTFVEGVEGTDVAVSWKESDGDAVVIEQLVERVWFLATAIKE